MPAKAQQKAGEAGLAETDGGPLSPVQQIEALQLYRRGRRGRRGRGGRRGRRGRGGRRRWDRETQSVPNYLSLQSVVLVRAGGFIPRCSARVSSRVLGLKPLAIAP